jgi:hypothetical protein
MARSRNIPPLAAHFGRELLIGLGRIGGRAVASAAKSVMKDGTNIARQAQARLERAAERIDEMVAGKRGAHRDDDP